jgi:hypothetical protein
LADSHNQIWAGAVRASSQPLPAAGYTPGYAGTWCRPATTLQPGLKNDAAQPASVPASEDGAQLHEECGTGAGDSVGGAE